MLKVCVLVPAGLSGGVGIFLGVINSIFDSIQFISLTADIHD